MTGRHPTAFSVVRLERREQRDGLEAAASERDGPGAFLREEEGSWSHLADRGWHRGTVEQIEVELTTVDCLIDRGLLAAPDNLAENLDGPEPVFWAGPVHVLARPRRAQALGA